jgi:hypothetical protein
MTDDLDKFDNCELYEEMYIVEKILEKKKHKGVWKYKVKWEGYSYDECTWEPKDNLTSCKELIDRFERDWKEKNPPNNNSSLTSSVSNENLKEKKIKNLDRGKDFADEDTKKIKKMRIEDEEENKKDDLNLGPSKIQDEGEKLNLQNSQNSQNLNNLQTSSPSKNDDMSNRNSPKSNFSNETFSTAISIDIPEGNLDEHSPLKIENATILDDVNIELNCLVSWNLREDGIQPMKTWISSNIIRKKNPELLLKYYESKVKLPKPKKMI